MNNQPDERVNQTGNSQRKVGHPTLNPDSPKNALPGFSDESEPTWAPPEAQPEPIPTEPILNDQKSSTPSDKSNLTNHSPA